MEKTLSLSCSGFMIPCRLTQPSTGPVRRVVLGVHGLCGSADDAIQSAIAEEMDLFHAATLRFDFPAHGQSPADSSAFTLANCMGTLLTAARWAAERFPETEDLCIFATGFGAYVTLAALQELLELPKRIRLVVHTPSVLMHDTLLRMMQMSRETFWAMDQFTFPTARPLVVTYRFYEELLENPVLTAHPIPMLILHGEDDTYIRMADIQHFRQMNEDACLVVLPGIGHRFQEDGARDMVLDLTRDWFEFEQVLLTDCV